MKEADKKRLLRFVASAQEALRLLKFEADAFPVLDGTHASYQDFEEIESKLSKARKAIKNA